MHVWAIAVVVVVVVKLGREQENNKKKLSVGKQWASLFGAEFLILLHVED